MPRSSVRTLDARPVLHPAAHFAQIGRKEDPSFQGQRIGGSAVEGATPLVEAVLTAVVQINRTHRQVSLHHFLMSMKMQVNHPLLARINWLSG